MARNRDMRLRGEGTAFEIDPPEPTWLEPPRPCGHEWRDNDFACMDCINARITGMEQAIGAALRWFDNEPGMLKDSTIVKQLRASIEP